MNSDSMPEEGLTLNAKCLVIQVRSSWYAVCLSSASQNNFFSLQQTCHNNEFFIPSICNFLQVLRLSSPTHDNNCCFLHAYVLNRSLRTRSPRKTSCHCTVFYIHSCSFHFPFEKPRLFHLQFL